MLGHPVVLPSLGHSTQGAVLGCEHLGAVSSDTGYPGVLCCAVLCCARL